MSVARPPFIRGPVLDLALPASEPEMRITLRNKTTGKTLSLRLPAAWAGDDLSLDFARRTILDQTGADRSALLEPSDLDLWSPSPLLSGLNDVEIEARKIAEATSLKAPGTVTDDASVGTAAWSNTGNVTLSDDTYASATLAAGAISHYLKCVNFNFTGIPADAEPLKVRLELEKSRSAAAPIISDHRIRLVKGGVVQSVDKASGNWLQGDSLATYDFTDPLSRSDVVATDFGVVIAAIANGEPPSANARVDRVRLLLTYKAASSATDAYAANATLRWWRGYP